MRTRLSAICCHGSVCHVCLLLIFSWVCGVACGQQSAGDDAAAANKQPDGELANDNAPNDERAAGIQKADVLDWVDQLGASSLTARKKAERKLIDAGPDALQWLPEIDENTPAEVAARLTRVRGQLQSLRTRKEIKTDLGQVVLRDVRTLGEALEAISRDTGVEFELDQQNDQSKPVSPIPTPLPFWHALDYVLDATDLDINFYGGDTATLLLVPRQKSRPLRIDSAAYAGVYRIEPTSVTAKKSLTQPDLSGLNISVHISWQPTTTPIGLTLPVNQLSGQLSDGSVLRPQNSGQTIDVATNGDLAMNEFFLPMQLPVNQPTKIKSLSGVVKAMLPGKRQTFELSLSELAATQTIDAMTVKIEDVRKNGPLQEIRLAVQLDDAKGSLESHRQWIFENDVFVKRQDGTRADHLGYQTYRQTTSGVGVAYMFDLGDAVSGSTLIYNSPTAIAENEVAFVIQDIEMP